MKRFSYSSLIGVLSLATCLTSCSNSEDEPNPKPNPEPSPEEFVLKERQDISLTEIQKQGISMQNDFAFRLFKAHSKDNNDNSLISPLSVEMCVSMAANGASDNVRDEILNVLLPKGTTLDELNSFNKYLTASLIDVDNSSVFSLSNSVWVDQKFSLLTPFSESLSANYNALSEKLNLYSQEAAGTINYWINATTKGLIPKLYEAAPAQDFILINTMYFKGQWTVPFEEGKSEEGEFRCEDGTVSKVTFMKSDCEPFNSKITQDFTAVELPYGNEAFSLVGILPAEGTSLNSFISELTAEKWNDIREDMNSIKSVFVNLPRFETNYTIKDMGDIMTEAGIGRLFTDADVFINAITPYNLNGKVSMLHKTVFKVDEKGAEGAALTEIGWVSAPGPDVPIAPNPVITFDRPFIYIVAEKSTGAILFIGTVRNL
ncbi:MAG: serpin family protein [Muribaculaceae bacterium]|nr:serpin family protein [Muribaculaceae bacterium]MDE6755317.1 serpin family protein [Muribaculaceae bacterium]